MKLENSELLDYVESSGPTRVAPPIGKQPGGRRLALVVVGAAVVWAAISFFTGSQSNHGGPSPGRASSSFGPASSLPTAADPSLSTAPAEYVLADQPTTPSYRATDGARYSTAQVFLGPVDATITRNQPGDYTVTLHNFAVVGGTIRVAAYGGSSTCSDHESDIIGADEQIRVICTNLGTETPLVCAGPFAGGATDSRFAVDIIGPTSSSGR
jgi:hypothetical protein